MSCKPIQLPDGSTVLAMLKPGEKLTPEEIQVLAEYAQFRRDRRASATLVPKESHSMASAPKKESATPAKRAATPKKKKT